MQNFKNLLKLLLSKFIEILITYKSIPHKFSQGLYTNFNLNFSQKIILGIKKNSNLIKLLNNLLGL
jgi:hypothetical protein